MLLLYRLEKHGVNLVIDIGNTIAEIAVFRDGSIVEIFYDSNQALGQLLDICTEYPINKAIVATVVGLSERVLTQLARLPTPLLWLDEETPFSAENLCKTSQTLEYDHTAVVVGANEQFPGRDILVVDAGACIIYGLIDAAGRYHGGNISPGVQVRFKTLHEFIGRLPLVVQEGYRLPLGKDTDMTMRGGILKGMEYEISDCITTMKYKYPELLVFLMGGDDFSFDISLRSVIFANRFLVLEGLSRILNYNNDRI